MKTSMELAELGNFDYFLVGVGLPEAAFFLLVVVGSVDFCGLNCPRIARID